MKIQKLMIKSFKVFEDVSFNFNEKINIFTGVNNSGKTTILEAIALWSECFNKLIRQAQRKDTALSLVKGDYRLGNKSQNYFDFDDIVSIRSPYYDDIFYNLDTSNHINISLNIKNDENENIEIGFKILPASGGNYEIKLLNNKKFTYPKFNVFFKEFPYPMSTIFASPIANLLINEKFKTEPIIKEHISKRESIKVLRNRLFNLKDEDFLKLEGSISHILGSDIKLLTNADKKRDTKIDYNIKLNSRDIEKNLSLVGSGTIQIIEILLSIFEEKKELNILLLDEPDSHIHRDIQKRLIDTLSNYTSNTQIFITTHNESLIRNTKSDYIFHLEGNANKEYNPITYNVNVNEKVKIGLQPTKKIKVLESLGSETSLDLINALESDKLILSEGSGDSTYLDIIINKKYIDRKLDLMHWSFDGVDNIFKHIFSYKEFFSLIKNEKTLWKKSVLIFDRDYFTDKQAKNLCLGLVNKLQIPVYIWNCYTFESILLTDLEKCVTLLLKYLDLRGKESTREELRNLLNNEISKIIEINKDFFSSSKCISKIKPWIDKKRESMASMGLQNNILPEEIALMDIKEFHLQKLNNNDLSAIATKEDVEIILNGVLNHFEIEETNIFGKLLLNIDISTYFEEWNLMIKKIGL